MSFEPVFFRCLSGQPFAPLFRAETDQEAKAMRKHADYVEVTPDGVSVQKTEPSTESKAQEPAKAPVRRGRPPKKAQ